MKKFTIYLEDDSMTVKVGDKLNLTTIGKAPNMLMLGAKDVAGVDLTLCSDDPHDQYYLEAEKLESLPEDVTATVVAVESDFGVNTVIINIDELENI